MPAPRGRARHNDPNVSSDKSDGAGAVKAKAKAELNNRNTAERSSKSKGTSKAKANNTTSPAPVEWKKSAAKKYLKEQLKDENSPFHAMDTRSIYESDKRFTLYPFKNFSTNYRNLKKKIKENKARADFDNKAVAEDKMKHPRKSTTKNGYPHWNTHPAKVCLEDDVRDGTANSMAPIDLWEARCEYQDFPHGIFCVRVHSEKRKQREALFWVDKRNKKAMKKHMKEVAEMKKNNRL